jgi:hypothetical protein
MQQKNGNPKAIPTYYTTRAKKDIATNFQVLPGLVIGEQ